MILTAIFILIFTWSVARGISKSFSLSEAAKKVKPEIQMIAPVRKTIEDRSDIIHYQTYVKEQKRIQLRGRTQMVETSVIPGRNNFRIYLN
jgi:hypothetical protein